MSKRIISLLLALVMILSLGTVAFADEPAEEPAPAEEAAPAEETAAPAEEPEPAEEPAGEPAEATGEPVEEELAEAPEEPAAPDEPAAAVEAPGKIVIAGDVNGVVPSVTIQGVGGVLEFHSAADGEAVSGGYMQIVVKNGYQVTAKDAGKTIYGSLSNYMSGSEVYRVFTFDTSSASGDVTLTISAATPYTIVKWSVTGGKGFGLGPVDLDLGGNELENGKTSGYTAYGGGESDVISIHYGCDYEVTVSGAEVVGSWPSDTLINHMDLKVTGDELKFTVKDKTLPEVKNGWDKVTESYEDVDENGHPVTRTSTRWYYYKDNKKVHGWLALGGKWYYFDPSDGAMYCQSEYDTVGDTGLAQIGGKWYCFNKSGVMQTGWKKFTYTGTDYFTGEDRTYTEWYYFTGSGAGKSGWMKSGGKWYYLDNGYMFYDQVAVIDGKNYFLDEAGVMKTGWIKLEAGEQYYMEYDASIDDYIYSFLTKEGDYFYANGSGVMQKNAWVKSGGKWYYMGEDSLMVRDTIKTIGGKDYMFKDNGAMYTGWIDLGGGDYRYADKSGALQTSKWVSSGGKWYYLKADGMMARNEAVPDGWTAAGNGVCTNG